MVCVPESQSPQGVACKISRVNGDDVAPLEITIYPDTKVADLFNQVKEHFSYTNVKMVLQNERHTKEIDLNEMEKSMVDIDVDFTPGTKYVLVVKRIIFWRQRKTRAADSKDEVDVSTCSYNFAPEPPPQPPIQEYGTKTIFGKRTTSNAKPAPFYVGLVNQAMTCYLNSLLQALYMTPEFRNALYNWEYVDGSEKDGAKNIPYQLQKLFLNLQTSTKSAVETTSLTKSFGWDSTEAWQQHDIQELCRVMFDALEQKFKNTKQADLINGLYEGKMIDYVKCLECSTEKSREDTFLDIPLPVRPFGSSVAYNSVEEALRAFVQPETLEGNNQYHCEKCNKKVNAHKGLKFTKFPYLLTLHLKRFDFDYNSFHRIKLNDKVTFPDVLNLNSFIATTANQESPGGDEDAGVNVKCEDSSTTDSGTLDDECLPCDSSPSTGNHSTNHDQDDDEGIDMSNGPSTSNYSGTHNNENEQNRGNRAAEKGPYQYELFSIQIHCGSASGGHYYAYIKDLKTQEWFCFNDQSVNKITHDDIQRTYGGGPSRAYYSGSYSSSTNAYMLMYRQIDPTRNALAMQADEFPKHIQDLLKRMKETEENDRKNHEKQLLISKFKVYCRHPTDGRLMDAKLYVLHDETWEEMIEKAYKKFHLEGLVDMDQCRLVTYDRINDLIMGSFEGREENVLESWQQSNVSLLLEIRKKDEKFETYASGGIATKVFVIDVSKNEVVDGPISVRVLSTQTVKQYKQQLSKIVNIDAKQMKLVLISYTSGGKVLENDDNTLENEGFYITNKIFVANMFDVDSSKPFNRSALHKIIENLENVISLHFTLPQTRKEILEEIAIPPLDSNTVAADVSNFESRRPLVNPVALVAGSQRDNLKKRTKSVTNSLSKLTSSESHKERNNSKNNDHQKCNEDTTVRNPSPQLGEGEEWNTAEQSNSEDSSLSDSDRTLVGDAPEDFPLGRTPSPEEGQGFDELYNQNRIENWDIEDELECYFKAFPCSNETQKSVKILVDKRMRLSTLKQNLEPFVGVPVEYFKIFRYTDSGESECSRLTERLGSYHDGERLNIKFERALRSGEYEVKLYQLLLHSIEPFKYLCEWIVSKDMTVAQAKKGILTEIKQKYDIDIPFERCRLRKKNYKTPSKVFCNEQKFEELRLHSQYEMIVQELPDKETVTDPSQMVLFVRKWSPEKVQLGPFQEITMNGKTSEELKEKLSLISDIPQEYIQVARDKSAFPCNIGVLRIQNDLEWSNETMTIDTLLLLTLEDGSVLFYRDSRETPKMLGADEIMEILKKESSRLLPSSSTSSYSPRREKALKIYLDTK